MMTTTTPMNAIVAMISPLFCKVCFMSYFLAAIENYIKNYKANQSDDEHTNFMCFRPLYEK